MMISTGIRFLNIVLLILTTASAYHNDAI